ncbi:MAG: glycerol kinase GlpK [Selenomonadaceae bacterium]
MPEKYILGIDQSTQGTKALLFDGQGKLASRCDRPHRQIISEKGWVEHDAEEIYKNVLAVVKGVAARSGIDKTAIAAVGISNQRETAMAWNRKTGKPIYNAIVWQCARGEMICNRLMAEDENCSEKIKAATGLPLSPYFSAAKLSWILENVAGAKELMCEGNLCMGTMDTWLVYKLTGGKSFKTDVSNASRTQLFNINSLQWDDTVCKCFGIAKTSLPEICDSNALYGKTDFAGWLNEKIVIQAVMGDSHAALFGQACRNPGMLKATYGTGSSVMMNIGEKAIFSKCGLVTSLAWSFDGKANYVLEGNVNYTGAVVSWLKDNLQLIEDDNQTEELAENSNQADKSYFVPAFTGLGAPYWDSTATAMFTGITRITGKNEMVRAALDSIAYQIQDIVQLMRVETNIDIRELCVDGGPTKNRYLMQFQADIAGVSVKIPAVEELSGMGVAFVAGISMGIYDNKQIFEQIKHVNYMKKMQEDKRKQLLGGWHAAVKRTLVRL